MCVSCFFFSALLVTFSHVVARGCGSVVIIAGQYSIV